MFDLNAFLIVLTASLVTAAIRFLPFFLFGERKTPAAITYVVKNSPAKAGTQVQSLV